MKYRSLGYFWIIAVFPISGCNEPELVRIGVAMGGDGNAAAQIASSELVARGITEIGIEIPAGSAGEASPSLSALEVAHRLAADPSVLAVVGHSNSEASLAASAVYNQAGLVQIAPTSTTTAYRQAGDYSFRLVPDDGRQADFILQHVAGIYDLGRVAVAFVNDEYGRSLYYRIREGMKAAGHDLLYEAGYVTGADSAYMARLGASVARAAPEILIWLGRAPELPAALHALRAESPLIPVLASDGVDTPEVYADANGRYSGLIFVRLLDAPAAAARDSAFLRAFAGLTNHVPTTEAVLTYDAIMLLVDAIRTGANEREAVQQRVAAYGRGIPPFAALSGPISFDEAGDVMRPHQLAMVTRDGVRALPPTAE